MFLQCVDFSMRRERYSKVYYFSSLMQQTSTSNYTLDNNSAGLRSHHRDCSLLLNLASG